MKEDEKYSNDRSAHLVGLGPATADLAKTAPNSTPSVTWRIPLQEPCSEVLDDFSMSSFKGSVAMNQHFFVVMAQFKLLCSDQSTKKHKKIKTSLYIPDQGNVKSSVDNHFN
jgi:hypothetical protein